MGENNKAKSSSKSDEDNEKNQGGSASDLGEAVSEASEQMQEQVMNLTQQVRQQAGDQLATQKDRLADTLETVALLLHQASEHADLQDKAGLAGYVTKASGQVETWSETLRQRDASQLMEDTVQFARRQPMLFLSGALAAGFAGARFLRSSTQSPETTSGTDGNGSGSAPSLGRNDVFYNADETDHITQSEIDEVLQGEREIEHPGLTGIDTTAALENDPLTDDMLVSKNNATSTEQR
jgi:hypothetical protein